MSISKLERLRRLKDPAYAASAELADVLAKIPMIKGDDGDTPVRGVDYFTEEDVQTIVGHVRALVKDGYTPVKGVDYSDGIIPVKGVDYTDGEPGDPGKPGRTPIKGLDYWTPEERDSVIAEVVQMVPKPKDGTAPKIEDIVAATIPVLRKQVSYAELKDAPALKDVEDLIAFLKRGGFRGGGSSGGAGTSPLTTKGDVYGFSTVADRIPVGANGTVLMADNTQALGVKWGTVGGTGTVTSVASADGSIIVVNPTTAADLSVVKAPKLSTARTINGASFDGTANITNSLSDLSAPTGDLSVASHKVTNVTDPTSAQDAATKNYVDTVALGQNFKEAVKYATTAALPAVTYSNGSSGVGATLTGVSVGALSVDGSTPSVGDRILVKNQVSTFQNGIYTVTTVGSGIVVFVLTRATDANQSAEWKTGDSVFVLSGTANSTTTWAYTGIDSPTMGTDALTFVQVAGQGSFVAGIGITITGNSIAVANNERLERVQFSIDGGGGAITTGQKGTYPVIPFAGTITGYNITVDQGTCTAKIWKKATGTAIPTVADNISTSGIAISSGTVIHSSTTSDFTTTAVAANDIFALNLTAVSLATKIYVSIEITRT